MTTYYEHPVTKKYVKRVREALYFLNERYRMKYNVVIAPAPGIAIKLKDGGWFISRLSPRRKAQCEGEPRYEGSPCKHFPEEHGTTRYTSTGQCVGCSVISSKTFYRNNKEQLLEYTKEWQKENKDKVLGYGRRYWEEQRPFIQRSREATRRRNHYRYHNDPEYRERILMQSRQRRARIKAEKETLAAQGGKDGV